MFSRRLLEKMLHFFVFVSGRSQRENVSMYVCKMSLYLCSLFLYTWKNLVFEFGIFMHTLMHTHIWC